MEKFLKAVKENKYLKIGILAVLIIIILALIFGGSNGNAKKAEKYVKESFTSEFKDADSVKVKTKTIGKNKDFDLYLIDTNVKINSDGKKVEANYYVIVYATKDDQIIHRQLEYTKENKSDIKDVAIAMLAKG